MSSVFQPEIPGYHLRESLGRGQLSEVFRAYQENPGRNVALKILRTQYRDAAERHQRFEVDLKRSFLLKHPHLVKIYGGGTVGRVDYIAMELLSGQSLSAQLTAQRILPARQALQLAHRLCRGLVELHAAGIVHRDITPDNILIRTNGSPTLLEPGMRSPGDWTAVTSQGDVLSPVRYLAPEVVQGEVATVSSDLWSLGALLYLCLTGASHLPFDARGNWRSRLVARDFPAPHQIVENVPEAASALVMRLLSPDRGERPGSAMELEEEIRKLLAGRKTIQMEADKTSVGTVGVFGSEAELGDVPEEELELDSGFLKRYELGDLLGAGAMGTVYRARERATGETVAIKFLLRLDTADGLARFVAEGRLSMKVKHPNVVRVKDFQQTAGRAYLVSEYIDGGSLEDYLEMNGRLPPAEAVRLMTDILAGLEACHQSGIVHRDLKPPNILLTATASAKLTDLGIAKDYSSEAGGLTRTGGLIGTPQYMAPEQALGRPVSVASDLYSAGLILYEMLTGTPAVTGDSLVQILVKAGQASIPPITGVVPTLPATLVHAVQRALQLAPADRPRSAMDLAQMIRLESKTPRRRWWSWLAGR